MTRYKLDDLGWYQFEQLIQSLLKAELGSGVESWGGHSDLGRDAYCAGTLRFPGRETETAGPFIFQAKFVQNANAAGSRPAQALTTAAQKEARRIRGRREWQDPRHYVLITNAPLSPGLRAALTGRLGAALPGATVHLLGGQDVCGMLDLHPALRRSFPQLLGIADLQGLISEAVSADVLARSEAAIAIARDLAPVFVPTAAYNKALRALVEKHFAVLDGPPEMGKTAIAWVIALTQLAQGWECLACQGPDDFFQMLDPGRKQVFVADDAFGSTEYDPSAGRKWERDLHRIIPRLDERHWLTWTSRKHILERARSRMDLQGAARRFPDPAEIVVEASSLSVIEKALMLYRHAKAANLGERAKMVLRGNCVGIVTNNAFTPERIRRFVREALPNLSDGRIAPEALAEEISRSLGETTERTRKSFRALDAPSKWFLVAVVDAGDRPTPEEVKASYEALCPAEHRRDFDEMREELGEAFLKAPSAAFGHLGWAHPTYRDLVIEELSRTPALRRDFLARMSVAGLKLVLGAHAGGGASGRFELAVEEWPTLETRAMALAGLGPRAASEVVAAISGAASTATGAASRVVRGVAARVYRAAVERLEHQVMHNDEISAFYEASLAVFPLPAGPPLAPSWNARVDRLRRGEEESQANDSPLDPDVLKDWAELAAIISSNEPRFLVQQGFPKKYEQLLAEVTSRVGEEMDYEASNDPAEVADEAERLETFAEALGILSQLTGGAGVRDTGSHVTRRPSKGQGTGAALDAAVVMAQRHAEHLRERAAELEPEPGEDLPDDYRADTSTEIGAIFEDL